MSWSGIVVDLRTSRFRCSPASSRTYDTQFCANAIARKHYVQITFDHLRAGCGLESDAQVVAQVVADSSLIASHAPSAKVLTLQNKGFPVIDRPGPSQAFCT